MGVGTEAIRWVLEDRVGELEAKVVILYRLRHSHVCFLDRLCSNPSGTHLMLQPRQMHLLPDGTYDVVIIWYHMCGDHNRPFKINDKTCITKWHIKFGFEQKI